MKITFLGTGTSQGIPIIGCNCNVCRSINPKDKRLRSSLLITHKEKNYVIDVGPDFRFQMLRENVHSLESVFLTHEHNDHIIGLDDLRPFIFKQKKEMIIYGLERVLNEVANRFEYAFKGSPYPGVPKFGIKQIRPNESIKLDEFELKALEVMHGNLSILGYATKQFAYLTDVKEISLQTIDQLKNIDLLIISSLRREGAHHSHMILQESLNLIEKIAPKKALLTHLSHRMGLHEEVSKELPQNVEIAFDGYCLELDA